MDEDLLLDFHVLFIARSNRIRFDFQMNRGFDKPADKYVDRLLMIDLGVKRKKFTNFCEIKLWVVATARQFGKLANISEFARPMG